MVREKSKGTRRYLGYDIICDWILENGSKSHIFISVPYIAFYSR